MSNVFVLDTNKQPLNPVHPGRARILLTQGKAAVFKRYPFTLILKTAVEEPVIEPLRLKLDPGSRTTGIAIVNDASGQVVFAAELAHRGQAIKAALETRRAVRRSRRARKTRYRKSKWQNRKRKAGWIAPSLESRVHQVLTWTRRLCRVCPIGALSLELVRFDTQAMENPEITNKDYQQGSLQGYEARAYLLEKWKHACSYCGKQNIALQIEHIQPRAKGGTNRISNLCLACEPCNSAKGTQDIAVFLAKKPEVLRRIQAQARAPFKDASAVNSTRWLLYERLKALGLPVECGTGGRTRWNRTTRGLAKSHWCDGANVGASTPEHLHIQGVVPLLITAAGHGNRQMAGLNRYGFPIRHRQRQKRYSGFQTGDIVRAHVPTGKHAGLSVGRVLVRATGSFDLKTKGTRKGGIAARYCQTIHHTDGYAYA